MVRPRVRDLFQAFYPAYRGEEGVFRRHLAAALSGADHALDVGCGSGVLCSHDLRGEGRVVVGIDPDPGIARNPWVTHAVRAGVTALPLAAESADLVVARYVLEHVDDPGQAFREIARVLRPGGRFVFLTPNAFHYVAMIARFTPTWLHRLAKAGHGVEADDVFPTLYRANTGGAIRRLAADAGFQVASIEWFEASPNYLEFSRVLYRLGVLYERTVSRFPFLAGLRVSIVATLVKLPDGTPVSH